MAGGYPAPSDRTDTASHINPQYDANEDGLIEEADDANTVQGLGPNELRGFTRTDVAETFAESDVTLSHTRTRVANESVEISEERIDQRGSYWGADPDTRYNGISATHNYTITMTEGPFHGFMVRFGSLSYGAVTQFRVVDVDTGNNVYYAGSASSTFHYVDGVTVESGQTLRVEVETNSTDFYAPDSQPTADADSPYDIVDSSSSYYNSSEGGVIDGIDFYTFPTDGTVTVEWPEPTDILDWDSATYLAAPDEGALTVDVIDPSDGTVVLADIDRGADLSSLDPSTNIALRVSMTRPAWNSDSPNLRAAYRRWEV